jgi:hypothetical protein
MTASLTLDPRTTAFLFMDFQNGVLPLLGDRAGDALERAGVVLTAARAPGGERVQPDGRDGQDLRSPGRRLAGGADRDREGPARGRTRGGEAPRRPFEGRDLAQILRAHATETLVLCGVSTSGVVLSTVRSAFDADYGLVVVEDACADADAEVHRVLTEKVFTPKATVMRSEAVTVTAPGSEAGGGGFGTGRSTGATGRSAGVMGAVRRVEGVREILVVGFIAPPSTSCARGSGAARRAGPPRGRRCGPG